MELESVVTTSQPAVDQVRFEAIQDAGHPAALGDFGKCASVHVTAHGFAADAQLPCDLTLADTLLMQFQHRPDSRDRRRPRRCCRIRSSWVSLARRRDTHCWRAAILVSIG